MKKDVLLKHAVDKRIWGSAIGGAVGAIPGTIDLFKNKKEKSKSVAKLLGGIAIGGTLGHIGTSFGKLKNKDSYINDTYKTLRHPDKQFAYSTTIGMGIGSIPGLIQMLEANKINDRGEQYDARKKAALKILTGGAIGSSVGIGNTLFKKITDMHRV